MPINVLHILTTSESLPYMLDNHLKNYPKKGYKIFIACNFNENPEDLFLDINLEFIYLPWNRKINLLKDFVAFIKLLNFLVHNHINLIVCHSPKGGLLGSVVGFFANSVRIYVRHGFVFENDTNFKFQIMRFFERVTCLFSNKVINVRKSLILRSHQLKIGFRNKNTLLGFGSFSGIDTERFNINNINLNEINRLREDYNISNNFVYGFIGRLTEDKGLGVLLDAWADLRLKYSDIKLIIVGNIDSRVKLSSTNLEKLNSTEGIILIKESKKVELIYSLLNVFILPSRREGLPTVNLEASSMSVPVITSKSTGCIDSIIENETGIFCKLDRFDIAKKMEYYYLNRFIAKIHGNQGRRFVIDRFNYMLPWNSFFNNYLSESK